MESPAKDDKPLILIARIWNGIIALFLLGWSVLFIFITIKLASQEAWAYSIISAVFVLFIAIGIYSKLCAIRRGNNKAAGLDAFAILLSLLGFDINK